MAQPTDHSETLSTQPSGYTWLEPSSPADTENPPVYPHCKVWETESGHSIQMDDTKNRERVRIEHRSKTFLEMHPNGDEVHKIQGDGYEIIAKNKNVLIRGICSITVEGDCIVDVKGDKIENISGDYIQNVGKDYIQNVKGSSFINCEEDMSIGSSSLSGSLSLQSTDFIVNGDIVAKGDIMGVNITAQGKVNAKTGVTAGYLGFVSSTGGLTIGAPVAVPGQILCFGSLPTIPEIDPITQAVIVPALPAIPLGNIFASGTITAGIGLKSGLYCTSLFVSGFQVSDIMGPVMRLRMLYNLHGHPHAGPNTAPDVGGGGGGTPV